MPAPNSPLVLAIDQGTSATKAVLVNTDGTLLATASKPLSTSHRRPGWAEQDALEIWASVQQAVSKCLNGVDPSRIISVGLSTQRESTLLWERGTGRPIGPMLGWQDTRGGARCERLRTAGLNESIRTLSGLPIDPMWSSSKATWLLDTYDRNRFRSRAGELCLGTVDSWLVACLGGRHVIEAGNASRTQLLNLITGAWDPWLLAIFDIPVEALPAVVPSVGSFATAGRLAPLSDNVPVAAVMGDSHSALFAHGVRQPGEVKATYGTGSSVMGLTEHPTAQSSGLCRSIAWKLDETSYALEGNIRSSGATLAWLADVLETTPAALAEVAADDSGGVTLVPAFTGLGAPWWDETAVAVLAGLTLGTGRPQLARAALESMAFQIEDVVAAIESDVGPVETVLADGGATTNSGLMQIQADLSGRAVMRATARDLSAIGAAQLAGVSSQLWTPQDLEQQPRERDRFSPALDRASRRQRISGWRDAVARARLRQRKSHDQH